MEILQMIGQSTNVSSFPSLEDYLREVERSRLRALVSRDMELAWQLHAPDFQLVTPRGNAFSREQYLGKIESGALRYLRWEPGPIVVRTHEETALLRYQATAIK